MTTQTDGEISRIMMITPIHANNREAIEIFNYLKGKLHLPDNVVEFTLNFKYNDLLTVDCKYYPKRGDADGHQK